MTAGIASFLLAAGVAAAAVYALLRTGAAVLPLDVPNERSLHRAPVPRVGGVGVLVGASVSIALGALDFWFPLGIAIALAVVSFMDDLRGLPPAVRLFAHMAAATALVVFAVPGAGLLASIALVLATAWITNLYNFMDGSDGLAGGMALIGFATYAIAAAIAGSEGLMAMCASLAGAACGFLMFNFHPARVFLGDVGSIPLGFLAAALGIAGWRDGLWPLWFPVLVFGPFIGDATITLLKRILRRERVWEAHRDHYYQRMVRLGLGHRGTAWVAYGLMSVCAVAALWGRELSPPMQAVAFGAASAVLAVVAASVDLLWARRRREPAA